MPGTDSGDGTNIRGTHDFSFGMHYAVLSDFAVALQVGWRMSDGAADSAKHWGTSKFAQIV